jgi:hypothetical protein
MIAFRLRETLEGRRAGGGLAGGIWEARRESNSHRPLRRRLPVPLDDAPVWSPRPESNRHPRVRTAIPFPLDHGNTSAKQILIPHLDIKDGSGSYGKHLVGRRRIELRLAGLKVRCRAVSACVPKHLGTGVEDRTPLILLVGQAPSPDDNPGMVAVLGFEPSLYADLAIPRDINPPMHHTSHGPKLWLAGEDSNLHIAG